MVALKAKTLDLIIMAEWEHPSITLVCTGIQTDDYYHTKE